MAVTRYLVEGDRLDVFIDQVKRMGHHVIVFKAEKVHKGDLAGMSLKEHYKVLVEVERAGKPPEQLSNATTIATATSARPQHHTSSEQA